jgi:hypothetical protein
MALSAKSVATLKTSGRYRDGDVKGLYRQVVNPENRSWIFRYERDGRERWMGLGPLHTISLKEAREKARAARRALLEGVDPLEAKREARAARAAQAAKTLTFAEAANQYFEKHETKWKNDKHRAQFLASLTNYAFPVIGALPVAAIDTGLVSKVLEPIWLTKTETASRVRMRVEAVLDFCTVRDYRSGDNPAPPCPTLNCQSSCNNCAAPMVSRRGRSNLWSSPPRARARQSAHTGRRST